MTRKKNGDFPQPTKVRYAIVGLGHIAQAAVLPAFANAGRNSLLTALFSDDREKLDKLGDTYEVPHACTYDEYDDFLASGEVDAVYIALPNHLHASYTERAARAGVHVLCEKPMAVTEGECEAMINAVEEHNVKLMIAYRLHFEEANLKAIELVNSGRIGEPRIFNSVFTMQVKEGNSRLQIELGGGTLFDIGIYCINAARYLFWDEPEEVVAFTASNDDGRFGEVEEMTSALLRFPEERLATFTCSFGAADVSAYRVVGTDGDLRVEPAYEYAGELKHHLTLNGKTQVRTFEKRDQFAPELLYFSECILNDKDPEPNGWEGLADVRIIQALYESARIGKPIRLAPFERKKSPTLAQEIRRPAARKPVEVHAENPMED